MADISEIILPNNSNYSIKDSYARSQLSNIADSIPPEMSVLSYGYSTWADFISAYNSHSVVYCRASSNSNPASGTQTRMAFMAYVNNGDNPTNVEFQYYRSVSTHSASQQGDQVYIYKLDKTAGWSVTVREAKIKIAAGTGLTESFASNTLTLSREDELPAVTASDDGKVLTVSSGNWAAVTPDAFVSGVKGDAESTYRTGNVNLTPADLGIINFTGATSEDDGASGLVPTPTATNSKQILLSNGNWTPLGTGVSADSNNDTLTVGITGDNSYLTYFTLWPATESQPGLMSTENVVALNGKADASDLNNYLPLSGGTLTGKLIFKDNNIDIATTPSSDQYSSVFEILDSNEKQIMNITNAHEVTSNYHGFSIGTYDSETGQQNTLQLSQNNNDSYKVWISQPAAWRSALGVPSSSQLNNYLPLTGGALTGKLSQKDNIIDRDGTNPSNLQWSSSEIDFIDKDEDRIGFINVKRNTNGSIDMCISAENENSSGEEVYNTISMGVAQDGTKTYSLSDPAAFRTAIGVGAIGLKATLSSADIPANAANTSGNAGTATKLATARSLYVALGTAYNSSSPVTFDGSAAKALPVNGTLAIAHGGTGKTTATEAWTALGGGAIGKKASLTASDLPTVPITKGGTGATTTANAQKALMGTADTNWAYLKGSANVTQYSRWRCKSGIVFVELYYTANAGLSTTNKNFGTIPTGYRPNKEVDVAAYLGQNVLHFATMWVDTGGNVVAKTADGTSNSIYCSLSYPL